MHSLDCQQHPHSPGYLMLINAREFEMNQLRGMISRLGRHFFKTQSVLMYVLLAFFSLQGCSVIIAETRGDQTTISETVTIESKGDGGIIIAERRYVVMKSTTILDISGKAISLCDLRVPSEALVEYRLRKDQDPVCVRIENKRLLEGATSLVIVDDPG
jgi:hypothetical protein